MDDLPCLCASLRKAAAASTELYNQALEPVGLNVTMFRLMRHTSDLETPSISDLAASMGLERSTLGRNLRVLERQGLVQLGGGEDARAKTVALSPKGRAVLQKANPLWQAVQYQLAAILDDNAAALLGLLAKVESAKPTPENRKVKNA